MGVPVLLPAIAFPTHLALEGSQTHVLVHVLLEIFGFIERFLTAAVEMKYNELTRYIHKCRLDARHLSR